VSGIAAKEVPGKSNPEMGDQKNPTLSIIVELKTLEYQIAKPKSLICFRKAR
jgi:hypothetical protein